MRWWISFSAKSHDNANYHTYSIQSTQEIQFLLENQQRLIKTQAFLKDRLTIELDNLSNSILTKTSHHGSIKFLR
jgi:hypothetical protein